jgi:Uma2 family endonuclease
LISFKAGEQTAIDPPRIGGRMSSATTNSSMVPSPPLAVAPRSVPTLEDLYQMTSEPDQRVVIRGVDWAFYEQLADSISERCHIHVDYDGKDVEIMSPGLVHDNDKRLIGQLVEAIAQVLGVPYKSAGQTSWKRPDVARGLEADESYFFRTEKLDAVAAGKARRALDIADYPNPDLGIEVDMSPPKIDRPGIYAALKVAEVWRFDGERQELVIERLADDGTYRAVDRSSFLPVSAAEIRRWVVEEGSHDECSWALRLRDWVSAELAPRLPG